MHDTASDEFDRQIRAIGFESQDRIAALRVGVIGLGGLGSLVVQQLVHLGVSDFVLVEDDRVELSNLPRLAGALRSDAIKSRAKVDVARRLIQGVAKKPRIEAPGTLRATDSLRELQSVDLIVGCVDNDGARLILAELAASRLIPYLDLGVSVELDAGVARSFGGRASFFLPGGPCLACADEIDFAEAAEDLEDEGLRRARQHRGYARDRKVEAAVMPLNTVIAGAGMVELLAYVSGIRPVRCFMRYEGLDQKIVSQNVRLQPECPVCVPAFGMGDRQMISRYALPTRR
jgi:molybdopterin/thiamine biosynthesis adenylyltransferase